MGVYNFCKIKSKEINLSKELTSVLLIAALFHDFGKLDDSCQKILSKNDKTIYSDGSEKMINHVDAGVCFLINKYLETKNKIFLHSAALIKAHHIRIENQNKLYYY